MKWVGRRCQRCYNRERAAKIKANAPACVVCGERPGVNFITTKPTCNYCRNRIVYANRPHCRIDGCTRPVARGDGLCKKHWDRMTYKAKKRALVKTGQFETVDPNRVAYRDGWVCQICGEPVDPTLAQMNLPDAPSIDHVHPLSRGGEHTYANVRLAHRRCNTKRGAPLTW